jgi:predicted nucleic acid-binding protein
MKEIVFVDTDIIYDLLSQRQPFYQSAAKLFTMADENKVKITVSALSIANIHYLISKQLSSEHAKQILRKFKILIEIVQIDGKIIDLALNSDFNDFEDAIQYYCALENDCNILLTRNLKDYKKAQITVMTAQDFINL